MTETGIYEAMKGFLETYIGCPEESIIRGWQNRYPLPEPPFIVISIIDSYGYSTDYHKLVSNETILVTGRGTHVRIQLDCYGGYSYQWAEAIAVFFRDYDACEYLRSNFGISPLYAESPQNNPVVTGENQYNPRWMVEVTVCFDSEFKRNRQTFNTASVKKQSPLN